MTRSDLLAKYDVPVPRYTSYPTVPAWRTPPPADQWIGSLAAAAASPDGSLAIYVHLPFCESLCTYCGCNTVITRDHGRSAPYIDTVLAELDLYIARVPRLTSMPLRQLHLGGGTPTFLSAGELARLVDGILGHFPARTAAFEGSIEVDPRVTTRDQLEALAARGFRRISLGVQDIDQEVQRLVNRIQPLAMTAALCDTARQLGYESVNVDLIYGLPGQTPDTMAHLAEAVLRLAPDRLAVYSFARVPWIKPAQRKFRDDQIPAGAEKRALYETIRQPLLEGGYVEIGLDHFATPGDALAQAAAAGTLHRNFMGYTDVHTTTLLGLGVSAISETDDCYHQNEKVLPVYERRVQHGEIPTLRGHLLSAEDRHRRDQIAALMTGFTVQLDPAERAAAPRGVRALLDVGLVRLDADRLIVPPEGRAFLRNAAAFFDEYLVPADPAHPTYSKAL
jgi:oxygen-independent coproporphyrinogen-3 oxidase